MCEYEEEHINPPPHQQAGGAWRITAPAFVFIELQIVSLVLCLCNLFFVDLFYLYFIRWNLIGE